MATPSYLVDPTTGEALPGQNAAGGATSRCALGFIAQARTTAGAVTVKRPSPRVQGSVFAVTDQDGNAAVSNITVDGDGDLIDGAATYVIATALASAFFEYDGGEWRRLINQRETEEPGRPRSRVAEGPIGPQGATGATGATGPAGPGNVFSGTGGGNTGTLSASEVLTDATADPNVTIDSKLGHQIMAAADPPVTAVAFVVAANELWAVDAVVTAINAAGTSHARFNVRALFNFAGGVAVLLSGGTDTNPDATNTALINATIAASGTGIALVLTGLAGEAITFGWEIRGQKQVL